MTTADWVWVGLLSGVVVCLPVGFILGFAQGYACRDRQKVATLTPEQCRTGALL